MIYIKIFHLFTLLFFCPLIFAMEVLKPEIHYQRESGSMHVCAFCKQNIDLGQRYFEWPSSSNVVHEGCLNLIKNADDVLWAEIRKKYNNLKDQNDWHRRAIASIEKAVKAKEPESGGSIMDYYAIYGKDAISMLFYEAVARLLH